MYNTVKIEKGFYNLSGKTFSQALEAVDPSENYTDEALRKAEEAGNELMGKMKADLTAAVLTKLLRL